jgi:aspartyl-tRNA(Asn)/glutamyl-tRNA(Gln) amidotransferase subunit A
MSLIDMQTSLAGRTSSAEEVIRRSLSRYDDLQPTLNAFIEVDRKKVLESARAADEIAGKSNSLPPLHGVPIAYKDMFDRAGHAATLGSSIPKPGPTGKSAAAIRKLEEAGAIIFGALNMSEFMLGPTGHNASFGHCRNPHDPSRVSGGSSSGSGAAVAAGIVPVALGSDTGGSVRIPASCCGVVGFKPMAYRIDPAGMAPLAPSLDAAGVLASSVRDCSYLYDVLSEDDGAVSAGHPDSFSVAFPEFEIEAKAVPEVTLALRHAAEVFAGMGGRVTDGRLPDIPALHDLADVIQKAESAHVHMGGLRQYRSSYSRHVRRRIEAGFLIAAPAYIAALNQRQKHVVNFVQNVLGTSDALLVPTMGIPVPLIDETDEEGRGDQPSLVPEMTYWTRWVSYLDLPAISLPCGVDANGMPMGMQLVGPPKSERKLLQIAMVFEGALKRASPLSPQGPGPSPS